MFKICDLTILGPDGQSYTYQFSEGINYFQGKNDTGKTVFYKFIDYMLGSSDTIGQEPWYKESFLKASITILYKEHSYIFTRTKDPEMNFFRYSDENDTGDPIDLNEYKDKLNSIFTANEKLLKEIRKYTGENLTYRTFTLFSFLGETGQGILSDFFDKCEKIEYSSKLNSVLGFIFNEHLEEIFDLQNRLEFFQTEINELNEKAEKHNFICQHINEHLHRLNIKTVYNGYNTQEIRDLLRAYKKLEDVPPAKKTKPISELMALYSNIEEQIKVYENSVSDNKRIMQENQNRQLMLAELSDLTKETPELQYLTQPIAELLNELDKSIAFSQYLTSENTIRELRKQKVIVKRDIERQSDRFQRYSIDQKTRSIAVIEEYMGLDGIYSDVELKEKIKKAREIKKRIEALQGLNDEKKIVALSDTITSLYKSAASVSAVVQKDIDQKGFHIDYVKRGNILKPVVDAKNGSIHYYTGSMARHTLIQFCGYLGFLELLIREGRYPLIPVLVVDHISKPFDMKNRKTIGAALEAAYKLIGKENLQVFIFDDKTSESIGIKPDHKENLATKTKTGFSPFFHK